MRTFLDENDIRHQVEALRFPSVLNEGEFLFFFSLTCVPGGRVSPEVVHNVYDDIEVDVLPITCLMCLSGQDPNLMSVAEINRLAEQGFDHGSDDEE